MSSTLFSCSAAPMLMMGGHRSTACTERYGATPEAFLRPMGRASATKRATQSYGSLRRALAASGTWALSRRVAVGCTLKWIWEMVSIARHSGVVTYQPESGSSDLGATLMFLAIPGATVQDQFRTVGGNPSK